MNDEKTALEKMRDFVSSYPDADILEELTIDYTDNVPNVGGLFPGGLVEVSRSRDVLPRELGGTMRVFNQYNFALYTKFEKSPDEDYGATLNAEWLIGFQEWIQEQSAKGLAPTFGDEPSLERLSAQNGTLFSADEEGTALYVVQLSASFVRIY